MTFSLATFCLEGVPTPVMSLDGSHYKLADAAPATLAADPSGGLLTVFRNWTETECGCFRYFSPMTDVTFGCFGSSMSITTRPASHDT